MAEVLNVDAVVTALGRRVRDSEDCVVAVGFTAAYAVHVHENLEASHPVGQAKFLEQPARELAGDLGEIIKRAMLRGASLAHAVLLAGLRLQRESQELVPVDTGALKGSAFTVLEEGEE